MADKERNALIPLPAGGLENIGSGPKSILSGMVSDALALVRAREKSLAAARFRIGDYEFSDPDYRQILIWAEEIALDPDEFVSTLSKLKNIKPYYYEEDIAFEVVNGKIISLLWDFEIFPKISAFRWVDNLSIQRLGFANAHSTDISVRLPSLQALHFESIHLAELDLSGVPNLEILMCDKTGLTKLNLSNVPALARLNCRLNHLANIDLSNVPALKMLDCQGNHFTELDLSNVPALDELICGGNKLTELDLSNVPMLSALYCNGNKLIKLNLSNVPALSALYCESNHLAELDIRRVLNLKYILHDPSVAVKKLPTQNPRNYT